MNYRVQIRINKRTGEIEVFQVDDTGVGQRVDHDAAHDEIAQTLGALVERRPEIEEVLPVAGVPFDAMPRVSVEGESEPETRPERETREH
ncbi:hypothetical protein [Micromonospora parva]|uniref:hypothetical protein n=1 Tax=Micromonospora parva TaxID=1464048 RepID=UPI00340375BA